MMKHELVKKRDKKIEVMTNEWFEFGAHDDANMTLHHTFYCPRNDRKTWYVCRGVPTYKGPSQQIYAEKDAKLAYSTLKYLNNCYTQLNNKLRSHVCQYKCK